VCRADWEPISNPSGNPIRDPLDCRQHRVTGGKDRVDFELNEDQVLLKGLVENFVEDRYDLARRAGYQREAQGFSTENWRLMAELGLLALPFAAGHGGLDGGVVEIITVMEALGAGLVAEPVLPALLIAGRLIEAAGTDAQKAAWLPRIIAGEARIALAHFEHAARYNLSAVATTAKVAESGGTVIDGAKTMVMAGVGADGLLVSARLSGGCGDPAGIGLFVVPADARGVDARAYRLTDGSVASEVHFRGVTDAQPLAGGFAAFATVIDEARIAACAEMLGIMTRLFDATLEHVRTRKQFGAALGSFQVIQHRMADNFVRLEQSRSQLYRAALAAAGAGRARAIAGAKSLIAANAIALGEDCIQLHGGMGTTDELAIGHGHKRLLLLASLFGDADAELERYLDMAA